MKREKLFHTVMRFLSHYAIFFLVISFAITGCVMLFVETMAEEAGVLLTNENVQTAAKLTFLNVAFLSFVCTLIDWYRRRITVTMPVRRIIEAAKKMTEGDFSVRISHVHRADFEDGFNRIIDCFNALAEELSGTETLRTDFIANVSHELKTPLAVMKNYALMLRQPGLGEAERMEYSREISAAADRLSGLISNILKLNKLENQQLFPAAQEYDLSEQVIECLLSFEDIWEKKNIELETDIEEGIRISSDRELWSIVWNNLLSNALKFTPEGGSVSVSLSDAGESVVFSVEDTGCGISREMGSRIFDKFYQGDTSHATEGNGLGLALVKRIIDISGSEIAVESEQGKGSRFSVIIGRDRGGEL